MINLKMIGMQEEGVQYKQFDHQEIHGKIMRDLQINSLANVFMALLFCFK